MRGVRLLLWLGLLLCSSVAWGQDTHHPLPSTAAPSTFNLRLNNFLTKEPADRTADATTRSEWVVSGCLAADAAARVLSPFACTAYTRKGHYALQASTGIDLAAAPGPACATTDLAWVIISDGLTAPGGNFVQVGSSQYWVDCASTAQPQTPDNAALLFVAQVSGGATTVRDLRKLAPTLPARNNAHGVDTVAEEAETWWGDSAQPYVIPGTGCTHAISATTSAAIAACRAYVRDAGLPRRLRYVEESIEHIITYSQGDGTYWLLLHAEVAAPVTDWNRVVGSHYLTHFSANHPATPNNSIIFARITVAGGAITAVDATIAISGPYIFDAAVYAVQYGMVCDGVTDNSAAMASALAAVPATGGKIILPASRFSCKYGTSFVVTTKALTLSGAGGAGAAKVNTPAETTLEYSGSGCAIEITGGATRGSVLENFELDHTGTANYGICIGTGNSDTIRHVTINVPTIPFALAGIRVTATAQSGHSHTITNNIVTNSAPIGLELPNAIGVQVVNNTIQHHSACNIALGSASTAKDTHIVLNRLENNVAGHTDAWAICAKNAEGAWITHNHFEVGEGANGILRTLSSETKCEQCVLMHNQINMLDTAVPGNGLLYFDVQGGSPAAYVYLRYNRIEDNRTAPPTTAVVELGNTSGNGGASIVSILDNEITATLTLVNDPALIKVMFDHNNNWSLGTLRDGKNRNLCIDYIAAGNVGTGEDNLMPACTVLHNRFRADGIGLYIYMAGDVSAANQDKQVRLYFDGQKIFDTGVVNLAVDVDAGWAIECRGVRTTGSGARFFCQGNGLESPSTLLTQFTAISVAGLFADPIPIQLTGEATTTNAIRQFYQYVELVQQ